MSSQSQHNTDSIKNINALTQIAVLHAIHLKHHDILIDTYCTYITSYKVFTGKMELIVKICYVCGKFFHFGETVVTT